MSATPTPSPKPHEIVVIEDNEAHLELIQEALAAACLTNPIRTLPTGQQARAYLRECAQRARADAAALPCVIILDLQLPDAHGLDLLQECKQDPVLHPVPVVILTTSDDADTVDRAYSSGANSYLVKPVRFEDFHQKVLEAGLYWAVLNEPTSS